MTRVRFEKRVLAATSMGALAAALTAGSPASAQAVPNNILIDEPTDQRVDLGTTDTLEVTANGTVVVTDQDAVVINGDDVTITNDGTIRGSAGNAIDGRGDDDTVITNNGLIETVESGEGGFDVIEITDSTGVTITNTGSIIANVGDTKAIDGGSFLTVTNSGIIRASGGEGKGIEGDNNLTVTNQEGGLIEALGAGAEAVEADGPGLFVENRGTIRSEFDDGIDGGDEVTILNFGLIEGNNNDGVELNSGSIDNSGTIISLASDPNGTPVFDGGPPELDAAIDFDTGTPGAEDGTVINRAGGLIEGDIGIETSPGNVDNPTPNEGSHVVFNFGTITGRMGTAVSLGLGEDRFFKVNGGIENGRVDGGEGFDVFAYYIDDATDRTFDLSLIGDQYSSFEVHRVGTIGFDLTDEDVATAGTGILTLTGFTDQALFVANAAILDGSVTGTVVLESLTGEGGEGGTPVDRSFTVTEGGVVNVDFGDAIQVSADDYVITNNGTIRANGGSAINAGEIGSIDIINNDLIEATYDGENGIDGAIVIRSHEGSSVVNEGTIRSRGEDAINGEDSLDTEIVNNGLIESVFNTDISQSGNAINLDNSENASVINTGTIRAFGNRAIDGRNSTDISITNDGRIESLPGGGFGRDVIDLAGSENATVTNSGDIFARVGGTKAIDGGEDMTVTNSGIIRASGGGGRGVEGDSNLTVINEEGGLIEALGEEAEAIEADSFGLRVTNRGTIRSESDVAINGLGDVVITNFGLIEGNENYAVDVISGVIDNSGTIVSLGSGAGGESGYSSEPDAAIYFSATGEGFEDGLVINRAGGLIEGDTGISTGVSSGDPSTTNQADHFVVNSGTITGREGSAVLLGDGDDLFVKLNDGIENGTVDGGSGLDLDQFAFIVDDATDRSFDLSLIGTQYVNFELFAFGTVTFDANEIALEAAELGEAGTVGTVGTGIITLTGTVGGENGEEGYSSYNGFGEGGIELTILNAAILDGTVIGSVFLDTFEGPTPVPLSFTVTENGLIEDPSGGDAVVVFEDGYTITNAGIIRSFGGNGIDAGEVGTTQIVNSGLIESLVIGEDFFDGEDFGFFFLADDAIDITGGEDSSVVNTATGIIRAGGGRGIDARGTTGTQITNDGLIESNVSPFIGFPVFGPIGLLGEDIGEDSFISDPFATVDVSDTTGAVIVNTGTIRSNGARAIDARGSSGVQITNSGLIESIGSDFRFVRSLIGPFGPNNAAVDVFAAEDATIANDGTIRAEGAMAINGALSTGTVIENSGLIESAVLSFDGEDGEDGEIVTSEIRKDFIIASGTTAINLVDSENASVTNSGTIRSEGGRAIDGRDSTGLVIENSGLIESAGFEVPVFGEDDLAPMLLDEAEPVEPEFILLGEDAIDLSDTDGVTITNSGEILARPGGTKAIDGGVNLTVTNSGTIRSFNGGGRGIEGDENLTINNLAGGIIEALGDGAEAVEADGPGLTITNAGTIRSEFDDAIDGDADVTITNSGLIEGNNNDAIELTNGTITNSGTIISLASDPDGTPAFEDGPPELDAAIDFDAGEDGNEDGTVTNLAGGVIEGDIGIVASPGNIDSPDTNDGVQTVVNFGTITGRMGDAALLGNNDDEFQQWQTGVTNGLVDGQAGNDLLVFGNNAASLLTRSLDDISDPDQYNGFETTGFLDIGGGIALTGASDQSYVLFGGDLIIQGELGGTLNVEGAGSLTVDAGGEIDVDFGDGVNVEVDDFVIVNNGTIRSVGARAIDANNVDGTSITNAGLIETVDANEGIESGEGVVAGDAIDVSGSTGVTITNTGSIIANANDTKAIDGGDNLTVVNSGIIRSRNGDGKGIEGDENLTVTNEVGGLIEALGTGAEAVEADGPGLVLVNRGTIRSEFDDAVDGGDDVTITNSGLISGNNNDGIELNSGTITNSGIIESRASDPNGTPAVEGGPPELDAAIDFDAGTEGSETGRVVNLAGGIIRGDIGIEASPGNVDNPTPNRGSQTVINSGTIIGRLGDAVRLGEGDDRFEQLVGGIVQGRIDLGAGNDTFILGGLASSVANGVFGGAGTDTATLSGTYDANILNGFETVNLGNLRVIGARSHAGNTTVTGTVVFGLGVDSIAVTGNLTLAAGSRLVIGTPRDRELLGQTVAVITDTGTFTNSGASIIIVEDDDLLLDYTPVLGSVFVRVSAANPLGTSADANIAALSGAVQAGLTGGTLSNAAFGSLNNLANVGALETAFAGALPALSGAVAREIFETSNAASQALDRHLAGEGSRVWGQVVVRGADQDARTTTATGYESDQRIFTAGVDLAVGETFRLGLLASYADIEIDNLRGLALAQTDEVESIKIGAYFGTSLMDRGFVNGEFAYLTGQVDSARTGTLGAVASSYDFDGFTARATAGYDILDDENVRFVPSIGLNYASIGFDDATEIGAFGFTVDREDADFLELRGGIEVGALLSEGVDAFISGTVIRDLEGGPTNVLLTSAQLPAFSVVSPLGGRDRFELAAGGSVVVSDRVNIDVGYLGDYASGYNAHSARLTLRIGF